MSKIGKCTLKVPNGKMIKVTVEFEGGQIMHVHIRGDFFIHPEEGINDLEDSLKGTEYAREKVSARAHEFFERSDVTAFGIKPEALTQAIMNCREAVQ